MTNRNANIGRNVEALFKNSVGDHPKIIKAIQKKFRIEGRFTTAILSGIQGEKADVKISFACGRNIDANIKAYKTDSGFNQLTRTTVSNFSKIFDLNTQIEDNLTNLIITKSKDTNSDLFPIEEQETWRIIFSKIAPDILRWAFSYKESREIIVLYERNTSVMRIYSMKDSLLILSSYLTFTKGGFNLGECVSFQRKGGNGKASRDIPKSSIKHPGNNVQLKLKINKFIELMKSTKLGQYKI